MLREKLHPHFQQLVLAILFILNPTFANSVGPNNPSTSGTIALTGSSNSSGSKTNIYTSDDLYSSNTPFLSAGQYSDYLYASGFGFSIPAGSTITGIQVDIERNDASGKIKDNDVKLVIGGIVVGNDKASSSSWPSSDKIKSYGSAIDLWGTTISYSDVNSSQFGVALSVIRSAGAGTNTGYVDHIKIIVSYSSPLPVELLGFTATKSENSVVMNWSTATEIDNDYFEIERSSDGNKFETVGTVKGAGNSVVTNFYSFVDLQPMPGVNYYRLKQVDFNGNKMYSPMVAVEFNSTNTNMVTLFPNPAANQVFLTGNFKTESHIIIYNTLGQVVKDLNYNSGSAIDISELDDGHYILMIHQDNSNITTQLVKSL